MSIVFPKVVSQVARFLECLVTPLVETLEEIDVSLGLWVLDFDHSMPFVWNTLKMLDRNTFMHHNASVIFLLLLFFLVLHERVWIIFQSRRKLGLLRL